MSYTFDENLVSDLHKDARGFRPTEAFWNAWNFQDDEGKQAAWNTLLLDLEDTIERERLQKIEDLAAFERDIALTISYGAGDRATALRWMTQNALFRDQQDIEHWVWERGILFTDEGRQLVKDLMNIVTFQEWEAA